MAVVISASFHLLSNDPLVSKPANLEINISTLFLCSVITNNKDLFFALTFNCNVFKCSTYRKTAEFSQDLLNIVPSVSLVTLQRCLHVKLNVSPDYLTVKNHKHQTKVSIISKYLKNNTQVEGSIDTQIHQWDWNVNFSFLILPNHLATWVSYPTSM